MPLAVFDYPSSHPYLRFSVTRMFWLQIRNRKKNVMRKCSTFFYILPPVYIEDETNSTAAGAKVRFTFNCKATKVAMNIQQL